MVEVEPVGQGCSQTLASQLKRELAWPTDYFQLCCPSAFTQLLKVIGSPVQPGPEAEQIQGAPSAIYELCLSSSVILMLQSGNIEF